MRQNATVISKSLNGPTVLILEVDLFTNIGGGQSSYRRLVELSPWKTFYYFTSIESADADRPPNARPIPLNRYYAGDWHWLAPGTAHFYSDYLDCWQMARSVAEELGPVSFDVVDTPDYRTFGLFIRDALRAHGISVEVVALALHGVVSIALRNQWPAISAPSRLLAEVRLREHLQYRSADIRYGISEQYAEDWQAYCGLPVRLIDPLHIVESLDPKPATAEQDPELVYVGRRQRCKGADLAVDLAWASSSEQPAKLTIFGPDSVSSDGRGSEPLLTRAAKLRKVDLRIEQSATRAKLGEIFRSRSVLLLPSRYETFNLVALEALVHACPVFVGSGAGISRWIEKRLPSVADMVINLSCSRQAAESIGRTLAHYDERRARVVEAVGRLSEVSPEVDLDGLYEPFGAVDVAARAHVRDIQTRFDSFNMPRDRGRKERIRASLSKSLSKETKQTIRDLRQRYGQLRRPSVMKGNLKKWLGDRAVKRGFVHPSALSDINQAGTIEQTRNLLLTADERSSRQIKDKLRLASAEVGRKRVFRVPLFREMARLERKRGRDLVAATYCLRVMRWLGRDRYGDLPFVAETLRRNRLPIEAAVAEAMYADPQESDLLCQQLLQRQFDDHLAKADLPWEVFDDRRGGILPKVSVIVSLYNAASKLPTLLDNLRIQSLNADRQMEIVLVDSGSPGDEYAVFKSYVEKHSIPMLFARSRQRETIQAAWNRGIKASRGEYLCFIGADEGLHPSALSVLSSTLDMRPDVDWAMADSLVTNVDRKGVYSDDIMPYNRAGYTWQHVFLDTTYLSYVGGLYRRSIHDRYGYYDETFRGAGDTEFKLRILSRIKTLHVPRLLGVFNNYPEERTTQSPHAELEDLRAWYLHRTPAGIRYSYDQHAIEEAETLFRTSLSYRKAFLTYQSSDFDLAKATATYLQDRGENPEFAARACRAADRLMASARAFETYGARRSPRAAQFEVFRRLRALRAQEASDETELELSERPSYGVFNDNRHEQHCWSWSA